MRVLLTGGTGFIGRAVTAELERRGHSAIILSRATKDSSSSRIQSFGWDGQSLGPWAKQMSSVEAVIHLAGEPIAGRRWSASQKERIVQSRILGTRAIVEAIANADPRPKVFISASAVGYYGNVPEGDVQESRVRGEGFLAETCEAWEKEAWRAATLGVRTVCLRTGIVLERGGGALAKMILPFQCFVGGPLGSGKQWVSWIHRQDLVGIILFALEQEALAGPVNAVSPHPVSMKDFCQALGRAMCRPSWVSAPAWALRGLLGEMSQMLLEGQKAVPEKLLQHHFIFRYPRVEQALEDILNKRC